MSVPVVRIITRLNIGGPSLQAASLTHRLRDYGYVTTLVKGRLGPGEGDMSYILPPGLAVEEIPSLQRAVRPADDARAVQAVYRLLRRVQPAIVHTHMAKAGAVGRVATLLYNRTVGRRAPARMVHTYHGHVLEGYFGATKSSLFIAAERLLARATDRLIAISPEIRQDLLHTYAIGQARQYAVVPLGFDLSPFLALRDDDRRRARATLRLAADAPVVTTVGRLTAIKQHDLLLRAAHDLRSRHPRLTVLIVGDGELRASLEGQARALDLTEAVRFLGWRRDLSDVYAATDVFALTSRNEGTPVALIEAMAAGVPGVSTDVGGVAHVIPDDSVGRRVMDGDAAAFARAVEDLLLAPDRPAIGARAQALVAARFGIDRLVADVARLYQELSDAAI